MFGLFVFSVICEQITSVQKTATFLTPETDSSLIHKEFDSNFDTLIYNIYNNYSQLRHFFNNDNPIFWFLPFDLALFDKMKQVFIK